MNKKSWLALLAATGVFSACSTTSEHQAGIEKVNIPLQASTQNAGKIAQASLAAQGEKTAILFFIGGVPPGTTRPLRLYTYIYAGSCEALEDKPAYDMNNIVTTNKMGQQQAGWTFSKTAPLSLQQLRAEPHAIVVRTSPQDGNLDIFCGNIA